MANVIFMCSMRFNIRTHFCFLKVVWNKKQEKDVKHWNAPLIVNNPNNPVSPKILKYHWACADLLEAAMGNEDEEEDLDKETVGRKVKKTFMSQNVGTLIKTSAETRMSWYYPHIGVLKMEVSVTMETTWHVYGTICDQYFGGTFHI